MLTTAHALRFYAKGSFVLVQSLRLPDATNPTATRKPYTPAIATKSLLSFTSVALSVREPTTQSKRYKSRSFALVYCRAFAPLPTAFLIICLRFATAQSEVARCPFRALLLTLKAMHSALTVRRHRERVLRWDGCGCLAPPPTQDRREGKEGNAFPSAFSGNFSPSFLREEISSGIPSGKSDAEFSA